MHAPSAKRNAAMYFERQTLNQRVNQNARGKKLISLKFSLWTQPTGTIPEPI
jgi:hypothetical protein